MLLSTPDRVKLLAGITQAGMDALVLRVLEIVSAQVEAWLDRDVELGPKVEILDSNSAQTIYKLHAWPVTAIASLEYDPDGTFGGSGLGAGDFGILGGTRNRGMLSIKATMDDWPSAIKVSYTGGMAPDTAAFITAFPDVAGAVDLQCVHLLARKDDIGSESKTGAGGSLSMRPATQGLVPEVMAMLRRHRRANAV